MRRPSVLLENCRGLLVAITFPDARCANFFLESTSPEDATIIEYIARSFQGRAVPPIQAHYVAISGPEVLVHVALLSTTPSRTNFCPITPCFAQNRETRAKERSVVAMA